MITLAHVTSYEHPYILGCVVLGFALGYMTHLVAPGVLGFVRVVRRYLSSV
jgi:hypothetical protein